LSQWDDHTRFERPRRHTKPRTKDRPDYTELPAARVVTVDRGRYGLALDGRILTAMRARSLGRKSVVVGDEVLVDGDTSGVEGSLSRIVEVLERRTVLRRTADDDDPVERIVVANADQLVVVAALADPPPRLGLIDRCLVAAYDAGMDPLVILTKADLGSPDLVLAALAPLEVQVRVIERDGDLDLIRDALADRTSVLLGHSGVGKSTLVNALVPDADRATSHVNEITGRGRHTSTSAVVLDLPFGGRIIDTPGFRSFGLAHVSPDDVIGAFDDLRAATERCPRGCTHLGGHLSPECGLDISALDPARVASIRRILAALAVR
jgi:ribosome biogenesis GTPase